MSVLQLKRGTTAQVGAYTPVIGEPVYNVTLKSFSIGDGVTPGGVNPALSSPNLSALAGLSGVADRGLYFTGAGAMSLYTLSSLGRTLGGIANAAAGRSAIVAAAAGANGDITSLTGITTPLSAAQGGTGLNALGTGVATFLGTPSSANLAAAVTGETGSGALVFATSPTLVTPVLGAATADSVRCGTVTTKTASFTLAANETWVVCDGSAANVTITLPNAAASVGRAITIKNRSGTFTVLSASANVVLLAGATPQTTICSAVVGRWATMVCDGANWITMAGN